jgi:hypothetical protein
MKIHYKTHDEKTQDQDKPLMNFAEALKLLKETEERLEKKKKQINVEVIRADRGKWQT